MPVPGYLSFLETKASFWTGPGRVAICDSGYTVSDVRAIDALWSRRTNSPRKRWGKSCQGESHAPPEINKKGKKAKKKKEKGRGTAASAAGIEMWHGRVLTVFGHSPMREALVLTDTSNRDRYPGRRKREARGWREDPLACCSFFLFRFSGLLL